MADASLPTMPNVAQIDPAVTMDPASRTVDPSTGTVQGQLGSMLDSGSPLMEQAGANGKMAANDRGLVNSTMGVQAGESAMIAAATPIATADATAYNTAAGQNQANTQQANQVNSAAKNQINSLNTGAINTAIDTNAKGIINTNIQNSQNDTGIAQTNLNNASAQKVAAINDMSGLSKTALDAVQANNINANLDASSRPVANQTVTNNFKSLADFTAATAGIPGLAAGLSFTF